MRIISIYANADGTDAINVRLDKGIEYVEDELGVDIPHRHVRRIRRKHHNGYTFTSIEHNNTLLAIGICCPAEHRRDNARDPVDVARLKQLDTLVTVTADSLPGPDGVEYLVGRGVTVHNVDAALRIQPHGDELSPITARALEAINETDTDPAEPVTAKRHTGGRPPIGMEVDDGMLRAAENYSKVQQTLHRVERDEMSRADAANRLGCVRKTIDNALEKRELYRLDSIENAYL